MALAFQVLGVVGGGLALSALLGGRRAGAGVALVVAGVASVLFWTQVWPAGRAFRDERSTNARLSARDAARAPGAKANLAFLDWVATQMGATDTFFLAPDGRRGDAFVYQWSTYQLLPHRHTDAARADWLVFHGVDPRRARYDRARFGRPVAFAPNFAIARAR